MTIHTHTHTRRVSLCKEIVSFRYLAQLQKQERFGDDETLPSMRVSLFDTKQPSTAPKECMIAS